MKKYYKDFIILILLCGLYYAFDNATNYTSQQLDNYVYGLGGVTAQSSIPDSSYAVRLMPDHIVFFHSDTVKGTTDTIHLWRTIGTISKQYTKRYKFSITPRTTTIYVKVCGDCTDSVAVSPGEYLTMDYLHPQYDSTIYIIDSTSATSSYRFTSQGR